MGENVLLTAKIKNTIIVAVYFRDFQQSYVNFVAKIKTDSHKIEAVPVQVENYKLEK